MYEGSPTKRIIQVSAGVLLGILTGLCLFVGVVALYAIIFRQDLDGITLVISLIFTPVGIVGLLISKRLIFARGVLQGAGLLAPVEYQFLGYFFIVLSICLIAYGVFHSTMKHIYLSPAPLILTYLCFASARFRQGFKKDAN